MKDIMHNYYKHIALPASLALLIGMPLSAHAQAADGASKEKFVTAYVEIREVQQEYSKKLQNVEDKNKARQLQQQAQAEMVEVVESNGLTVEQYNQMVNSVSEDPELQKEIEQRTQAAQ